MSLRDKLIRLAYEQPQLRSDLLPLITKSAADTFDEWVKQQNKKGFPNPNKSKGAKKFIKFKSLPKEEQKKIREGWTEAKEKADAEKEANKPESHKKFDEMLKTLDPDVAEELPSPDQMDEWGEGDTLKEKYELWLEQNSWANNYGEHGEEEFSDANIIEDWINDHASKWEEQTKSGKKASLRDSLIRLAYENPELRKDLLPVITKSAKKKKYKVSFFKYSYRGTKIERTEIVDAISPAHAKDQVSSLYGIKKKTITSVKEIKSAGSKSIGFALSFSPLDIAEKEQEIEKIIRRKFKGSLRDYNYFVNVSVGDVPVLYISDSRGNGVSGTMFNNDWRDVIQALVKAKYLSVANFQKGIALAMRQKAYISDAHKFAHTKKSAGEHYDRWKMWSKLLSNYNLIAEIERRPVIPGSTELHIFSSRYKQYHNVDHQMGDVSASITYYDRIFTVHTGNKHSQYSIGDEKRALKSIVQYLLFS